MKEYDSFTLNGCRYITEGYDTGANKYGTTWAKHKSPQEQQKDWIEYLKNIPPTYPPCSLNEPLFMVIPREGVIISCQRHPEGHFIRPSVITY